MRADAGIHAVFIGSFLLGAVSFGMLAIAFAPEDPMQSDRLKPEVLEEFRNRWRQNQDTEVARMISDHYISVCHGSYGDEALYLAWRRRAASGGEPNAIVSFARSLGGSRDPNDVAEALVLVRRMARAGNKEAEVILPGIEKRLRKVRHVEFLE